MNNQQKRKAAYERLWLDELMAYADQSSILHSWEPLEYLDKGQFSRIFKIRHYTTGMLGALKFVPNPVELSDCAAEGSSQNAFHRSRFEASKREVEIMARFSGESNIVQHLERPEFLQRVFLDENGRKVVQYAVLICMPLYHSSKEWLPLCTENVNLRFQLALDMAHALTVFEQKGVYHRDIKPGNIMMDDYGVFYLSDVGEAKLENDHTTIGFHGTRPYMAPEVWRLENERGKAHSDHRSDIYSLGIVLYRLFNHHQFPFLTEEGSLTEDATRSYERYEKRNKSADPALLLPDTERARLLRYEGLALPAPSEADKELGRIILKACAYNLKDRYQTAAELQADLKNYLEKPVRVPGKASHAPKRKKRLKALLGVCAAGLVGVIAFCAYQLGLNSAVRPEAVLPVALTSSVPEAAVSPVPVPEATPTYTHTAAAETTLTPADAYIKVMLPSSEPTPTNAPTSAPTPKQTPTNTPKPTLTATPTPTNTPAPTFTPTPTPTLTPAPTPTPTPAPTPTSTPAPTPVHYAPGATLEKDGLVYTMQSDGKSWSLDNCVSDETEIIIPGEVEGFPVTVIGEKAFAASTKLESVYIPGGVTVIKKAAFSIWHGTKTYASSLRTVHLPDSITVIEDCAFYECQELQYIKLPANLLKIGEAAFFECELESIVIPEGVFSIGDSAFFGCNLESIIIPEGVFSIGNNAFSANSIKLVTLPDSVSFIGHDAFGFRLSDYFVSVCPGSYAEHYMNEIRYSTFHQRNTIHISYDKLLMPSAVESFLPDPSIEKKKDGLLITIPEPPKKNVARIELWLFYRDETNPNEPIFVTTLSSAERTYLHTNPKKDKLKYWYKVFLNDGSWFISDYNKYNWQIDNST